ncbi:permease prefix domain 1-containing protein [Actinoallomurus iriomotensis]|uniref:Uncharacterized protein n=1 Tax=Actinoallomurus iriomotensis TaxID=478107 RepID=A0A9W6RY15_9ACTN|nr:permease prefix domain 1-containing protein [Actinoallomurus iriomotensis]GLY84836.1 hypothetical protein Airi02_027650 [Actinoallomurus iriomotensis]
MTGPGAVDEVIGAYLAEIAARLTGPARARRDILAELEAGLADASDAHRTAGLSPVQAARAAVAEFGGPERVAEGFHAELAAAQARRVVLPLVTAGPLIGGLWMVTAVGGRTVPPWQWAGTPAEARPVILLAVLALATAIAGALFTMATTGRLVGRWPGRPLVTAAIAAGGTAPIDLTLLALFAVQVAATPSRFAVFPAATAAAASLIRLAYAGRAVRTCLATRALSRPGHS